MGLLSYKGEVYFVWYPPPTLILRTYIDTYSRHECQGHPEKSGACDPLAGWMRAVASPEQPADRGPAQPSSEPSPETPSAAVGPAVPAGMPAAWPAHTPQTPVQQPAGLAALGESQPGSLPAHTTNLPPPSAPAALSASTIAPGASKSILQPMQRQPHELHSHLFTVTNRTNQRLLLFTDRDEAAHCAPSTPRL